MTTRGWPLWTSGLGNYFVCERFSDKTLLLSLKFVIQINLEHETIANSITEVTAEITVTAETAEN